MKSTISLTGLAVLILVAGASSQTLAPTKPAAAEQELLKLEQDMAKADVKADVAFLDRVLAEDWEFTGADGTVWAKAEALTHVKSGEEEASFATLDGMKARVYGDAAVVTGRSTFKTKLKGKDISAQFRFTDTWIRKAGRWQCVATHVSEIKPE